MTMLASETNSRLLTNTRPASLTARLITQLASKLAPDLKSEGALERAIRENREKGSPYPPKRMLRRLNFSEKQDEYGKVFTVSLKGEQATPLKLLHIHGGAYVLGIQSMQWGLIESIMKKTRAEVTLPLYPLGPEHNWQETMVMLNQVYQTMLKNTDAGNIIITSDSAGGGLSMLLAQQLRDQRRPAPAGLVLFSPFLDLSVSAPEQIELERRDPVLTICFLREAAKLWAKDTPLDDPRVNPLCGNLENLPPILCFTGSRDVLDADAKALATLCPSATVHAYPEMMHVFPAAPIREGKQALRTMTEFINEILNKNV